MKWEFIDSPESFLRKKRSSQFHSFHCPCFVTEDGHRKQLGCPPRLHPKYIFLMINNSLKSAAAAHLKLIVKFEMWKTAAPALAGPGAGARGRVRSRVVV